MNNNPAKFDFTHGFYNPQLTFDENFDKGPYPQSGFEPYINPGEPKYSFLSFNIHSPFGIPAGSLPTSKHLRLAFEAGFDVNVYKTMRSIDFEVNQFPNIVFVDTSGDLTIDRAEKGLIGYDQPTEDLVDTSITNSFGNPGRGPEYWVNDFKLANCYAKSGQLLIMGVVGTIKPGFSDDEYYDDFAKTALLAKNAGAQVVEGESFVPKRCFRGNSLLHKKADVEVARRCKEAIGDTPMILKFGYFTPDQQNLLEEIIREVSPYAAAISAINTIPAAVYDEQGKQKLPGAGRLKAGVCGAGIKWAGIDMVRRLDEIRRKNKYGYEIIGVGGVMTSEDFQDYLDVGADLVQSATGSMWNLDLAAEVKKTLS